MPASVSERRRPVVRIVTPSLPAANNGNAHTAARWAGFLAPLADCELALSWDGEAADLLVALHARRSADAVRRFRAARPDAPIALVLTGTDVYADMGEKTEARHSVECASAVVVLQDDALDRLDAASRAKATTIVQSAPRLVSRAPREARREFVAVGHLRDEKDPLCAMRAACELDAGLRFAHVGAALDASLGAEALRTMRACASYRWLGALPHAAARRRIAGALALVHTSRIEGGAHVVIEAVRSAVPVLASRIGGNVGLLGADYEGLFALGDHAGLARLMNRVAADAAFATRLAAQCARREPLFVPARERARVRSLVRALLASAPRR